MFRSGGLLASGKRAIPRLKRFVTDLVLGDVNRRIRQLSKTVDVLEREIRELN